MYEYIDECMYIKNDKTRRKFNNLRLYLMRSDEKDPEVIEKKVKKTFDFLEKDDMRYFS